MSKQQKPAPASTVTKKTQAGTYVGKRDNFLFFGFAVDRKWYRLTKIGIWIALAIVSIFTSIAVINFVLDIVVLTTLLQQETVDVLNMQTFPALIFWIVLLIFVWIVKINIKE